MVETEFPITDNPDESRENNCLFLREHSDALQVLLEQNEPSNNWQIVWDNRDKLADHEEIELETLAYVDQVVDEIRAKNIELSPFVDEETIYWTKYLLTLVQRRRYEQYFETQEKPIVDERVKAWDKDQMKIFTYEMVYTAFLSRNRDPRKDGSQYWTTHLAGSVMNAICDSRITSLSSLIALLRHDDFEDLDIHKPEWQKDLLMCDQYYFDELEGAGKNVIFPEEKERVFRMVGALTNLKRGDEADFLAFVRAILDVGIRVAILRNNERSHNLDTVGAHGDSEKIRSICEESMKVHARMASSLLKMDDVEEHISRACFEAINPEALERFQRIQDERLKRYFGDAPGESNLMLALSGLLFSSLPDEKCHIRYMAIRPLPFTKYLDKARISDEDPFLKIDESDPMFEIVMLTESDPANLRTSMIMLTVRCEVMRILGESYGSEASWIQMDVNERVPKVNPDCGDRVRIFNPTLGGRVDVRINTVHKEALRPRGIISDTKNVEIPLSTGKSLKAAVKRFKGSSDGFLKYLEAILADPIIVRSRDNEAIELPSGANGIDYAAAIHPEVLGNFRAIKVADSALKSSEFRSPFYRLKNMQQVVIVTDPDEEVPSEYEYQVDLSWRSFAGIRGIDALKTVYGKLSHDEALKAGAEYVERLSKLFGFTGANQLIFTFLKLQRRENILIESAKADYALKSKKSLLENSPVNDDIIAAYKGDIVDDVIKLQTASAAKSAQVREVIDALMLSIGRCKTDPVEFLVNGAEFGKPVTIEVEMPNIPGSLDALTRQIKEYGINISNIEQTNAGDSSLVCLSLEMYDSDKYNKHDLIKCILRLGIEGKVKITSDQFRSMVPSIRVKNHKTIPSEPPQS